MSFFNGTKPTAPGCKRSTRASVIAWTEVLAGALIFMDAIGVVSYRSTMRLHADAAWVRHTQEVLSHLATLLSAITDAETGQRGGFQAQFLP